MNKIGLQMVDVNNSLGYTVTGPTIVFLAGGVLGVDTAVRNGTDILADTWYDVELEKNGLVVTARFKPETDTVWTEWTHTLAAAQDFELNYVCIQNRLNRAGVDNIVTSGFAPPLPPMILPGDANNDGVVSVDDYIAVQQNIGNHLPEPATIGLLAMGLVATILRKRK